MLDSSEWLYSKYFFVEKPLTLVFEHCQISAVFLREFWHWVIFFLIKVTYFNKIFSQLYVGPKNIHTMEIDSINESVYLPQMVPHLKRCRRRKRGWKLFNIPLKIASLEDDSTLGHIQNKNFIFYSFIPWFVVLKV